MRLVRAEISDFRSIRDVTIDFDHRCRLLVGVNEGGKSNLLHALSFLDPARTVVTLHAGELIARSATSF